MPLSLCSIILCLTLLLLSGLMCPMLELSWNSMAGGKCCLLGFFSHALTAAKRWYSVFERALLAAYAATPYVWSSTEGRLCSLFTDHWPPAQAVQHSDPWSPRQQHHIATLAKFLEGALYLPCSRKLAADALSLCP